MSKVLTVSNAEVAALLADPGAIGPGRIGPENTAPWRYIDVRTCEEFAQGHVTSAFNVPLKLGGLAGLTDNPDFLNVMQSTFAPCSALIVGCRSGARAQTAVTHLQAAGFTELRLHQASFSGCRDAFGRLTIGWQAAGYSVTLLPSPGHSYDALVNALG